MVCAGQPWFKFRYTGKRYLTHRPQPRGVDPSTGCGSSRGYCLRYLDFDTKAWAQLSKKEQRRLNEQRNENLRITEPIRCVTKWSYLIVCSSVLSLEEKDKIDGENEKLVCHRVVPRINTTSPNDPKHDDAEG
uniref:Uncharacterized protein n=1 Tax=Solanum tuberosum TaxID=4113 RepID=M1DG57_SOLTU